MTYIEKAVENFPAERKVEEALMIAMLHCPSDYFKQDHVPSAAGCDSLSVSCNKCWLGEFKEEL